ncbi:MAG: DNA-processing protein DprA [Ruminococcaceae bacterium]|nr:DNA-processing protein DprA [Oscillospiraceae bacterium]
MTDRECGFLLLGSQLGDPDRHPLTTAQLRDLANRVASADKPTEDRELLPADLRSLGYGQEMAERIVHLLGETERLHWYLNRGKREGCVPLTRLSEGYPLAMRKRLGLDSPGVLWAMGDLSILEKPRIALVGSREIREENAAFAARVGAEAALQGYVLVSGNARGADRIAQTACLNAGGQVICVLADELQKQEITENVLYLSEDSFDLPFSAQRAHSRNRVIHALGEKTFVAQCASGTGGSWSGTVRNIKENWSPVFCFRDGSEAMYQLEQLGAVLLDNEDLSKLSALQSQPSGFF